MELMPLFLSWGSTCSVDPPWPSSATATVTFWPFQLQADMPVLKYSVRAAGSSPSTDFAMSRATACAASNTASGGSANCSTTGLAISRYSRGSAG